MPLPTGRHIGSDSDGRRKNKIFLKKVIDNNLKIGYDWFIKRKKRGGAAYGTEQNNDSPTDYLYFLFHKITESARNVLIAGRYKIYQNSAEKLNIRLTKQEKQDIEYCLGKLNLSRTDTIIKGIGLVKKEIEK